MTNYSATLICSSGSYMYWFRICKQLACVFVRKVKGFHFPKTDK